jgi:O-acetylserine/cysteine efflux transporter
MKRGDGWLGVALMALWGLNFSVIKLGVDQINPHVLTAARFTLAAIPAVFFVRRPAVAWRYLVSYGLVFGVGIWGAMTWAIELGVSAGMSGMLLQLSLVSSLVLGWYYFGEAFTTAKVLGAVLALLGLLLALGLEDGSVSAWGLVLALVAACCWSLMGVIVKRSACRQVFAFGVWGMLFAPLPLLLMAVLTDGLSALDVGQVNRYTVFSVLFQAWPTTLLGYWFWNRLNVTYGLSTVAPLTLLVPVFALLGSVVFYQEALGLTKLLACGLILLGLVVGQGWLSVPRWARITGVSQ